MTPPTGTPKTTLALEEMLVRGASHVDGLVDARGRTYFDVFLTSPPEAVTDWPDFVDLPARYWEACALIASAHLPLPEATGRLRAWLFRHFEGDGLAYRPESPISLHVAEWFDQSRLMYALVTWAMHAPDDTEVRRRLAGLADGLLRRATHAGDHAYIEQVGLYYGGTLIRPMLQAGLVLGRSDCCDFAIRLARGILNHSDLIGPDGSFKGHVHGALGAVSGALACAIVSGDGALLARARAGFEYARSISTSFGFVPELAQRGDDMIACETCSIMDYLDAAILLARHVDPAYWDIVEKTVRNHLWESQVRDASWLGNGGDRDEPDVIRTGLSERMIGGFAGWSAPHCLLAYEEHHGGGWTRLEEMKPLYLAKVRAFQNCCAGAGIRAVHQVWSNIVTSSPAAITVNLSLDRATPDVRVTSHLPFEGRVRITVARACVLRWRYPTSCEPALVKVQGPSGPCAGAKIEGPFLNLGTRQPGDTVELTFPLEERVEEVVIGNAGHQQYRFSVAWRGDTVLSVKPDPANASSGFTQLMGRRMPASYGSEGLGPIYRRGHWSHGLKVPPADTPLCASPIDWYRLARPS
jgi:Beta-L-arabinofuranosidase, GH127